ncbi:MAG: histidine kinase [Saprospiraceae bacterium]|nr:histidine kinase [Saprospiraceae bacterium]
MRYFNIIFIILSCLLTWESGKTQIPSFYHLSTAEGLNDNNVICVATDKNGLVWLGTSEGLHSFDGNKITHFDRHQYRQLASNHIRWIDVDESNRIWLRTQTPFINMLDKKRKIHRLTVGGEKDQQEVTDVLNTKTRGIIVLKETKHFVWKDTTKYVMERISLPIEKLIPKSYSLTKKLTDDRILYYGNNRLVVINYKTLKAELDMPLNDINYAVALSDDEILAYTVDGKLFYVISIPHKGIVRTIKNLVDQYGKPIEGDLRKAAKIDHENVVITTRFSGLYFLNIRTLKLDHYTHDPLDPGSIGGNNTFNVMVDKYGYLFVTTQTSGLHYCNLLHAQVAMKPYFSDANKQIFDGYIQAVTLQGDSIVWLGAQDRLIKWNRYRNESQFVNLRLPGDRNLLGRETIRSLKVDSYGRLWVGTTRFGIFVLDRSLNVIFNISKEESARYHIPSNWINQIYEDQESNMWIATAAGTVQMKVEKNRSNFNTTYEVVHITNESSWSLFQSQDNAMWIGTDKGAFQFDATLNKTHLPKNHVLNDRTIHSINQDKYGTLYFGTDQGVNLLKQNGDQLSFDKSNGLKNDLCEGLLRDGNGFIWMGNLNCILRFDPDHQSFKIIEEGNGFSRAGFRMRTAYQHSSGEMFWGTDKGLVWFHPDQLNKKRSLSQPYLHQIALNDTLYHITEQSKITFPFSKTSYRFFFSSGNLDGNNKTLIRVKLKDYDKDWVYPYVNGQITYNDLQPGNYRFIIEASANGVDWLPSTYSTQLSISPLWWQTSIFRIVVVGFLFFLGYMVYRKNAEKAREIEMKKTLDFFENISYEDATVKDILWDICRNISYKLDLDDCVIYLLNEENQSLEQRAAYGPKIREDAEIHNPISIPFGKGIVGSVAKSQKAEVVTDTSLDGRYIPDDEIRSSEIAVPIIHENKLLGVIDSEHKRKNFYTKTHLTLLEKIAEVCAAKISKAMSDDAMKKSKLELMELQVKMAESRFMNLRLQMNPHFLFNALSSIQLLIVSEQTNKAYKYLTVFSNFLRTLLKYAEQSFILLDEELRILRMYIELEALRFDNSFEFEIVVDANIENDEVLIPTLLIQPFIENAIWHGLLHKNGNKKLLIEFKDVNDEYMLCIIEDNGVGRKAAREFKNGQLSSVGHESKGISIVEERLKLFEQKKGRPAHLVVEDLVDDFNNATGTRATITLPYYNQER